MYMPVSACPHCGSPIFMSIAKESGGSIVSSSGIWECVPPPTYSCTCREQLFAAASTTGEEMAHVVRDEVRKAQSEDFKRARRPSGNASGYGTYSAFGTGKD